MQTDWNDYDNNARKFIEFIDSNELISQFIESCGVCNYNMSDEFQEILSSPGRYTFSIGKTDEEETVTIYSILKYMATEYKGHPWRAMQGYTNSSKFADMVSAFNQRVVILLIGHITRFLTKIGIDMGIDENVTYNINNSGQVNIANDNSTINAVQNNNGINADELKNLIASMRENLDSGLSVEDKSEANECIDSIEAELLSSQPNETSVKDKFRLLKRIDTSVKFTSACCSLLTFADKVYPFISQIVPWFQSIK